MITNHRVVWEPLTHTMNDTCVMVWVNAPRHVAYVHPRVCFKQVRQQLQRQARVWLLYVPTGRRAEPICKMPPSTSLLSADTSGPQRFPVKLSSLYVSEQEPAERQRRGVRLFKTLIMINLCCRCGVICFIISSGVKAWHAHLFILWV